MAKDNGQAPRGRDGETPDASDAPAGGSRPGQDAPPRSSAVDPNPTELLPRIDGPAQPRPAETEVIPAVTAPAAGAAGAAADADPLPRVVDPMKEEFGLTDREARAVKRSAKGKHRILKRAVAAVAALLVVALVGGYLLVRHFDGNIHGIDVAAALGTRPSTGQVDPDTNLAPMNILVLGTDGRAELGTDKYGSAKDIQGARSDVTMIAHLAADRKSAIVVSIPRDLMAPGPTNCKLDQPQSQWQLKQFNSNFEQGGATCTMKVVEAMTGLYMDHFAAVDFNGFKDMVDALGTVEVCLTAPVKDKDSGANFPAGWQKLNGEQSLSFVRLRHTGDGSDTSRIKRQQDFLSSMIREATSSQLLLRPTKLYQFLDAATKSLTTDKDLASVTSLASVAESARSIPTDQIRFVSMPWEPYPKDPNRIQPSKAATALWKLLREDAPWPAGGPGATASPAPSTTAASPSASTTIAGVLPKDVHVDVVNASGYSGFGTQNANALRAQGFVTTDVAAPATEADGVVVHYAAADVAKAKEVAAAYSNATLQADGKAGAPIRLVVGRGASKVKLVPNAPTGTTLPAQILVPPPAANSIEAKTANENVCTDTSK